MRLTLTLPELEKEYSVQHGTRERILELGFMADRKEPIAIVPIVSHDQQVISAVLLKEAVDIGKMTSIGIKFSPIWCKVFTVCSYTKDTVHALVVEFKDGQKWVDPSGVRPCKMTTSGDGTDPKIVEQSQQVLGDLLIERPRPPLLNELIHLIQQAA